MNSSIRQRPFGITVLAILYGLGAGFTLFQKISSLVMATTRVRSEVSDLALLLALVSLVVVWGLWTLKPWALWAALVFEGINIIEGLFSMLTQHIPLFVVFLFVCFLLIHIGILIYLGANRKVRTAFHT